MLTTPGLGHFIPLVNVGRALQMAGHTVAVATAPSFGDAVTTRGFEVVPAGISMVEAFGRARAADPAWMTASQAEIGRRIIPDVWVAQFAQATMDDAVQLTGWQPDVVVREEGEFASTLIAAILGVPCVDVGWGPMRPGHLVDVAADALAGLWRRYGLQPRPNAGVYEWLYLDPCPPSLQAAHADKIDTLHRVQPAPMVPSPPAVELPDWFDRLDGRPAVYVTLGTEPTFNDDPSFFRAVIDGLDDEGLELVITIGPTGDPGSFGPQPDHVHIERFIPQAAVLRHCVAAITNGGSGSTVGALASGVPVLAVSSAGAPSQVRNAEAAAAFGAGRVLSRDEITPEQVREEIRLLTTTKSYAAQAQQLARENTSMPTPAEAATVIENIAETRQPYQRSE